MSTHTHTHTHTLVYFGKQWWPLQFITCHLLQPIKHLSPLANHNPTHNHIVSVCYIQYYYNWSHIIYLYLYLQLCMHAVDRNILHELLLICQLSTFDQFARCKNTYTYTHARTHTHTCVQTPVAVHFPTVFTMLHQTRHLLTPPPQPIALPPRDHTARHTSSSSSTARECKKMMLTPFTRLHHHRK